MQNVLLQNEEQLASLKNRLDEEKRTMRDLWCGLVGNYAGMLSVGFIFSFALFSDICIESYIFGIVVVAISIGLLVMVSIGFKDNISLSKNKIKNLQSQIEMLKNPNTLETQNITPDQLDEDKDEEKDEDKDDPEQPPVDL